MRSSMTIATGRVAELLAEAEHSLRLGLKKPQLHSLIRDEFPAFELRLAF